jgi:peptide methionine sulfoxide reductase MsrA
MKMAATFLLIVGCFWALMVIWLFSVIAGVADTPGSWIKVLP